MNYLIAVLTLAFTQSSHALPPSPTCVTYDNAKVCGLIETSKPGENFYGAMIRIVSAEKQFGLSMKDVSSGKKLCELFVSQLNTQAKNIETYPGVNFPAITVGSDSGRYGGIEEVSIKGSARFVSRRVRYACGPTCDASKVVFMLENLSCGYEL